MLPCRIQSFGEILTDKSVRILIRAALPGTPGVGKVHLNAGVNREHVLPCVAPDGSIAPARIEQHVDTYFQPMMEANGKLVPVPGKSPSFSINVKVQ